MLFVYNFYLKNFYILELMDFIELSA